MLYERARPLSLDAGGLLARSAWLAIDRGQTLTLVPVLLVLAAIGILSVMTILNYHAVTETFERAKSLMHNILQSITTGVLTLDPGGTVTSLNSAAEGL